MKKWSLVLSAIIVIILWGKVAFAKESDYLNYQAEPNICSIVRPDLGCPTDLYNLYNDRSSNNPYSLDTCVNNLKDFQTDPLNRHYWINDPEVISQAKADERARQFIYWVLNKNAIDDHPILKNYWNMTRNVAYFFVLIVVAVLGLGFIVSQKTNFNAKIKIWPAIMKILLILLYISFSATIVILLIQISEIIMKFFIENTGGKDLFNIYFAGISQEKNYIDVVGCRDLNYKAQEAIRAEMFLLKVTNITYYVMGVMLLLRKILLWFLLFVSPFLAILFPFVLIRNIGWIWIGVFFQWLFYGPLFALFLGSMANMWKSGIPFTFDFSRVGTLAGYVYPSGTSITYGGPAQNISIKNNGNYIDTFVEYVITLIMQWAVIFFPWWLLRIFRDYCCDGIYAVKNILMSMYDQIRSNPPGQQPTGPTPMPGTTDTSLKIAKTIDVATRTRLETIEEIRKTKTEDITRSLDLHVSKLTDIARLETNKQSYETVKRNLDYLTNPTKASTPSERQKYMNIRTELFNRAVKEDSTAKQILSTISSSRIEQYQKREELIKQAAAPVSTSQIASQQTNVPSIKVNAISSAFVNSISGNSSLVNQIANTTNLPAAQVQNILNSYKQNTNQTPINIVTTIMNGTGTKKEEIVDVLNHISQAVSVTDEERTINNIASRNNIDNRQAKSVVDIYQYQSAQQTSEQIIKQIIQQTGLEEKKAQRTLQYVTSIYKTREELRKIMQSITQKENVGVEDVKKVVGTQLPLAIEPEKHIEQTVTIPPSVSIEDYEEVKKMWISQYEKGEVPVTENITSREAWLDHDIVFTTNTLNKLMSADEKLRQQGLDDLAYILPIFLINNLKGEELLVYLKAKIEAAKTVVQQTRREKDLLSKLKEKSPEEEFVDVNKPKAKAAEKTMTMEEALENPKEQGQKGEQTKD